MTQGLWFTRATLRRDTPDVAPLLGILLGREGDTCDASHRLLWTLMPAALQEAGKGERVAFLWRRAPDYAAGTVYYVLGPKPRADAALLEVETKPWSLDLAPGDRLEFDLAVNATVERMVDPGRGREGRRRCDVVMDAIRADERRHGITKPRAALRRDLAETALEAWLASQGERNGFRLLRFQVADYRTQGIGEMRRPGKGQPQFGVARLRGLLEVDIPDRFAARVTSGFGRAKAFGCGLMLLKRAV